MQRLYDYGLAIWCQRGGCYRCKDVHCECLCHKGGVADPEIVKVCQENAVQRGSLAFRCQMSEHDTCKKSRCNCKCHLAGATPVIREEAPVASEEHVQELMERIYASEATFRDEQTATRKALHEIGDAVQAAQTATDQTINDFGKRLGALDKARPITIKIGKLPEIKMEAQHMAFEKAARLLSLGLNVYLRGPAGSGKTFGAAKMAEALHVDFYSVPLGPQTSESKLIGYKDAMGNYVESLLRRAYQQGGLVLLDEIDAANAAVLTVINGMLGNGHAGFADQMVEKHTKCYFIAAGNTYGKGADSLYVGRAQQDAAMLDRWNVINWDYDWEFAAQLCGNPPWTDYVHRLFNSLSEKKIRAVIGMRAVLDGAKMLAAGIPAYEVENTRIWNAISVDDRAKITAGIAPFGATEAPAGKINSGDEHRTVCPECGSGVRDSTKVNAERKVAGRAPLPDLKCIDEACKWKVWPKAYDWKQNRWQDED